MFEPIHLEYVLSPGHKVSSSYSHLFDLLDKIESTARDELLTPLYLEYELFSDQNQGTRKEVQDRRYQEFKKGFLVIHAKSTEYPSIVFGFVSFVLAEALRRSDIARFERIIEGHRSFMAITREEMVKEEMAAGKAWQEIRTIMDSIESLHKELEESRRAYRMFCAEVVKPLLDQGA
jgi:hypothetical protein